MQAEPPPDPPPAIVTQADDETVIEVVGTRSDQAQKIDRRTFRVKDNAQAAQSDTLQLLRGLPAIVITPDDEILLLGSGGVTVLVDERPIQGDTTQYLRTLRGSDIERIEIITNPSAQYAAQGSGGIINIVLRRKRADGVTGSASLLASSHGRVEGSATVKAKRGKWSFEVQAQPNAGKYGSSKYRTLRTVSQPDGTTIINSADGKSSSRGASVFLSGKASYDFDPKTSLSVSVAGGLNDYRSDNDTDYLALAGDFNSFSSHQRSRSSSSFRYGQFDFDRKGKVEGQSFKAFAIAYSFGSDALTNTRYDDGGGYTLDSRDGQWGINSKIDWVRPFGKSRILSFGATIDYDVGNRRLRSIDSGAGGMLQFETDDAFKNRDLSSAAYATYQLKFGQWTVMPGGRLERFNRTVSSPGRPSVTVHRTSLFPSFHLERPVGKKFTATASYARRIQRPNPSQLRPYLLRRGPLFFERGNPDLRDQTTDSYEFNFAYRYKKLNFGLILYDRETANLFDSAYSIDTDGNTVSTPVNVGRKSNRGAQVDVGLPLLPRVKGIASFNLFNSIVPYDTPSGTSRFSQLRYTANATINWQGKDSPKRPGDIGQLQLEYASPSRLFQSRSSGTVSANLSYTHSFSKTLAITGSVNGIGSGHSSRRLVAPSIQERYDVRTRQPEVKFKLVKTFAPKP